MSKSFPLEKIFGSRTRVKIITLFTTGIKRPYFVREIARAVNERLNAVRRELEILEKIGMLQTYDQKRRKYYTVNQNFVLLKELTSIMQKSGPQMDDVLFKNLQHIGDIQLACASGIFTGAEGSPTDLLIVGNIDDRKLEIFSGTVERHLGREITYTPITLEEYQYRRNFNDLFLRQVFSQPYKIIINKLESSMQPDSFNTQKTASPQKGG